MKDHNIMQEPNYEINFCPLTATMRQEGITQQEEFISGVEQENGQRQDKHRNRRRISWLHKRANVSPSTLPEIYVNNEGNGAKKRLIRLKRKQLQKESFSSLNLDYDTPPF
mmetsp:Transcript_22087/g.30740  ORF Transcript_22087/g.30740 Transcript_22087/m.30740 type:complete len:111 (-) Transcript_22087:273-605(-)